MARILLIIESPADRHVLRTELGAVHDIIAAESDAALAMPFDLCILDGRSLQRLGERVDARRAEDAPCFLPFLLLTMRQDIMRAPEALWQRIDDALTSPVHLRELWARVNVMLRAREASLLLDQERQALQESEEALRTLINTLPIGVVFVEAEGKITLTNPEADTLFGGRVTGTAFGPHGGYSLHRYDGTPYPPEELPLPRALTDHVPSRDVEILVRREQGGEAYILASASPVFGVKKQLVGAVAAFLDITERKRAEEARARLLEEVQARAAEYEATIDAIPDGYIVYTADGTIRRMNDFARQIIGFSEEEHALPYAERMATLRVETFDGRPFPLEQLPSYRALNGETVRGILLVVHRPHRSYWLSVSASPIITSGGQRLGAVMEFADITTLHTLQEQQRILLQMVSHDLRTPLTIVKGHAQVIDQLLDSAHIDGAIKGSLEALGRGIDRMNTLIQDMVDATRYEGGQLVLNRQPVALAPYLADLLRQAAAALEVGRIRVEVPADLPPVDADPARLERIFINLLSNALKYSDPKTPVIIRACAVDTLVEVAIHDRGRGIDAEDLPHLFTRFYRAKGAHKTEGIGLGLYITRILVAAHGGNIRAESEVGQGSTFTFTLPVARAGGDHA